MMQPFSFRETGIPRLISSLRFFGALSFAYLLVSCSGNSEPRRANSEPPNPSESQPVMQHAQDHHTSPTASDELPTSIRSHLKQIFELKQKRASYSAQYRLALPPVPRMAGAQQKRNLIADKGHTFYSESITEGSSSRLLLKEGKVYWEYKDPARGRHFFQGKANLEGKTPDEWLQIHGFVSHFFGPLDVDLLDEISRLLQGGQVTARSQQEGCTRLEATSTIGELVFVLAPDSFRMQRKAKSGDGAVLFAYSCQSKLPLGPGDPRTAFLALFADKQNTIHQRIGRFDLVDVMEQFMTDPNAHDDMDVATARDAAIRLDFLFPKTDSLKPKGPVKILRFTLNSGSLGLELEMDGKKFGIGQHHGFEPTDIPKDWIRRTKQFRDFKAIEEYDPGVQDYWYWYYKDDVALAIATSVRFDDPALDRLVSFFEVPKKTEPKK